MKVSVSMNKGAIRKLSVAQSKAMSMTALQMLNEVRNDQVIPFDTGNTQNESTYVDDSKVTEGAVSVVTDNPYARRLYYHPEYNFRTDKNPNARGEWWAEWLTGDKVKRPKDLFKAFYKRVSGGMLK